jgi:hypothetical protein
MWLAALRQHAPWLQPDPEPMVSIPAVPLSEIGGAG